MPDETIRVMLVDDHQLVREALERLLAGEPDLRVVATAADAGEALSLVGRARPQVVLMDVQMHGTDGISATASLLALVPWLRVVVLSATCTPAQVQRALAAGACGYLLKDGGVEELCDGVRAAAQGQRPMAPLPLALATADARAGSRTQGLSNLGPAGSL